MPLWMIFPVIFVALYLSHLTLLRLPYYWDEAGYYIPAAWDFFRTGSLIPTSHPHQRPSPAAEHLSRALLEGLRLLSRSHARGRATGGHARAARSVAARHASRRRSLSRFLDRAAHRPLSHLVRAKLARPRRYLRRRLLAVGIGLHRFPSAAAMLWAAALWFAAAALSKETSIAIPLTLAAINIVVAFRSAAPIARAALARSGVALELASFRWPPGTPTTTQKPDSSSAIRSFCATTPRPRSRRCASSPPSAIASCTSPRT